MRFAVPLLLLVSLSGATCTTFETNTAAGSSRTSHNDASNRQSLPFDLNELPPSEDMEDTPGHANAQQPPNISQHIHSVDGNRSNDNPVPLEEEEPSLHKPNSLSVVVPNHPTDENRYPIAEILESFELLRSSNTNTQNRKRTRTDLVSRSLNENIE